MLVLACLWQPRTASAAASNMCKFAAMRVVGYLTAQQKQETAGEKRGLALVWLR